jgi:serine/threonine-protein kinase
VQVALRQIRELPPALPGDVPDAVRLLIGRAIVKDPAERFADGATFRAAIDDVLTGRPVGSAVREPRTAVLAAVPAVGATASHPATRVLPAVTATPAPDPDPDEPDSEGRRRRGLLALVALLAVAAVVAGGLWLTNRGTGDGGAAATGPTTTATSSRPSAPPATPSAQLVDLASSDYVGRPASEVLAALQARGLVVTLVPQQTADVPDGQVIAVDPAGKLAPNSPVAVTYAVTPPTPPTPTATARATATATAGGNNGHGNGDNKGKGNGKGDD